MSIPVVTPHTEGPAVRCPEGFRYWQARANPRVRTVERRVRAVTGSELFPADEPAKALCADMFAGDPVAQRFVAEVVRAGDGRETGRRLLETALRDGIDSITEPPSAMHALFDEFETVPDWVHPEPVERGAAVWRRWGAILFSFAGAETLAM